MQRNARDWLGLVGHDKDALVNKDGADEDGYASDDASGVQDYYEAPSGQLAAGNGMQIAIVRPRNFQDAATVGEYFRQEIPVIINLEDVDNALATRIIDFASGLILGLYGDMERLSRRVFLIMPADATILADQDGLTEEGFFNQALWTPVRVGTPGAGVPGHDPRPCWPRGPPADGCLGWPDLPDRGALTVLAVCVSM